ncbi:hypothetical protein DFH09DRAFT_1293702 [Mycena vulgaris]|nr:hypothetical protein DFH09DRAFT_1293702 [Mycena vulgaris]
MSRGLLMNIGRTAREFIPAIPFIECSDDNEAGGGRARWWKQGGGRLTAADFLCARAPHRPGRTHLRRGSLLTIFTAPPARALAVRPSLRPLVFTRVHAPHTLPCARKVPVGHSAFSVYCRDAGGAAPNASPASNGCAHTPHIPAKRRACASSSSYPAHPSSFRSNAEYGSVFLWSVSVSSVFRRVVHEGVDGGVPHHQVVRVPRILHFLVGCESFLRPPNDENPRALRPLPFAVVRPRRRCRRFSCAGVRAGVGVLRTHARGAARGSSDNRRITRPLPIAAVPVLSPRSCCCVCGRGRARRDAGTHADESVHVGGEVFVAAAMGCASYKPVAALRSCLWCAGRRDADGRGAGAARAKAAGNSARTVGSGRSPFNGAARGVRAGRGAGDAPIALEAVHGRGIRPDGCISRRLRAKGALWAGNDSMRPTLTARGDTAVGDWQEGVADGQQGLVSRRLRPEDGALGGGQRCDAGGKDSKCGLGWVSGSLENGGVSCEESKERTRSSQRLARGPGDSQARGGSARVEDADGNRRFAKLRGFAIRVAQSLAKDVITAGGLGSSRKAIFHDSRININGEQGRACNAFNGEARRAVVRALAKANESAPADATPWLIFAQTRDPSSAQSKALRSPLCMPTEYGRPGRRFKGPIPFWTTFGTV